MAKTKLELVDLAHEMIGVKALNRDLSQKEIEYGSKQVDLMFAEITNAPHKLSFPFTSNNIPDEVANRFAELLTTYLQTYNRAPVVTWERGIMRLRAYEFPDNRPDRADLDEDGTVSEEEAEADLAAQYY